MGFIDEITKCLGAGELSPSPFRFVIIGGKGGYFEGLKNLESFCDDRVVLSLKGGKIAVEGKNLKIDGYTKCDAAILGDIQKIEVLK